MKIGIVLPSVPGYSETFFTSKIKGLQANGFEVLLFVNNFSTKTALNCTIIAAPKFSKNKLKNSFLSFYYLLKTFIFSYKSTRKLYKLNRKDNLTILQSIKNILINCHILTQKLDWLHFGFGTTALERENVAAAIGAKMAVSFRGFDHYVYPVKNKECYNFLFTKDVKYHVLSTAMQNDLMKHSIPREKIVKITPAIDTDLFLSKLTSSNAHNFVTVARLHWIKGLEYTLEALRIVKEKGMDFTYTIVGDGIEKERLEFTVHQLGLKENVFFLGKLNSQQVKEELEKATYYLQYSIQEGFCNAVLEAQAMGLVCVVSDAEGLAENVLDGVTGFVVAKRNPALLAAQLLEVMHLSKAAKESLTRSAVARIKSNFTIAAQINQFIDFYEN